MIKSERLIVLVTPEEMERLDNWRFESKLSSRGEAVRRLIELGLEAARERQADPMPLKEVKHG
jgi:metal-responsive CopG/Arc/MetJ family transcriptional regulator